MPLSVRTGPASAARKLTCRARQAAEHLIGPDRVERGEAVIQDDRDVHCWPPCSAGMWIVALLIALTRPPASGLKAAAVLRRCDLERADEGAAHRLGRAEAAAGGDRRDRLGGLLEPPARGLQAHALDVAAPASRRSPLGTRARSGAGSCAPVRPSPRPSARPRRARAPSAGSRAAARARAAGRASVALNCDWLPGRRRNSTR